MFLRWLYLLFLLNEMRSYEMSTKICTVEYREDTRESVIEFVCPYSDDISSYELENNYGRKCVFETEKGDTTLLRGTDEVKGQTVNAVVSGNTCKITVTAKKFSE